MNYFNLYQSILLADDETVVLPRSSSLSEARPGCTSSGTCWAPDTLPLFPGLFLCVAFRSCGFSTNRLVKLTRKQPLGI